MPFSTRPLFVVLGWVAMWGVSPCCCSSEPLVVRVEYDVPYTADDGVAHRCDVYRPKATGQAAKRVPVVLVIHGGAWTSGDKWMIGSYAQDFCQQGMAAVAINYRHAPEHPFPAQIDDVRDALIWVSDHAEEYGWDAQRIGMFGYSAGAHMACMIGTLADESLATRRSASHWKVDDERWQKIPKVLAIAAGGTPCEFRTLPKDNSALSYFLGGTRGEYPAVYDAASPAAHASSGDVPTLFVHGEADLIVPYAAAKHLFEKQQAAGVPSEFLTIEGHGHLMTFLHQRSRTAVSEFLRSHLMPMPH